MLSARLHQERYVLNGVLRPIPPCLVRAEPQALTGTHVLYPYTPQSSDVLVLMCGLSRFRISGRHYRLSESNSGPLTWSASGSETHLKLPTKITSRLPRNISRWRLPQTPKTEMKFGDKLGTNGGRNRPQRLARPCRRNPNL